FALKRVLAVPPDVAKIAEMERFRYVTLLHLLRARDLTLISIWNPTFLSTLLAPLEAWHERLCADPLIEPQRAAEVRAIWRGPGALAEKLRATWPRLALVSCWADAAAARGVEELRELVPDVEVQPKGLLATEGCVSFPLVDRPGAALALRS